VSCQFHRARDWQLRHRKCPYEFITHLVVIITSHHEKTLKSIKKAVVLCTIVYLATTLQPFNGPLSRTTHVSQYQKGKTNLDFTEARDSEWQWHQLGHMQVWTSLQTDNHTSTPPLSFLQAGCPSGRPTNSDKALKELVHSRKTKNSRDILSSLWRETAVANWCHTDSSVRPRGYLAH